MAMAVDNQIKLVIEALLFASDKPLKAGDIHACLAEENLSGIRQALKELQAEYDDLGRSFVLKEVAQGYQFRTKAEFAPFILQLLKTSPTRLSRAALETLAIIAYKQPILRQEIEKLRGVDAGGILKTLMEKGLVKIMGRKNLPGRPLIYGTTKKFLEVFDLKDIDSLPKLKEIKDFGIDEQGTPMPLKEVLPDDASAQAEGRDEKFGEEGNRDEPSGEADGQDESLGDEGNRDEPSGEADGQDESLGDEGNRDEPSGEADGQDESLSDEGNRDETAGEADGQDESPDDEVSRDEPT